MKYLQISTVVSYTSIGRIMRQNYDARKAEGWDCLIAYGRGEGVDGYNTLRIGNDISVKWHGLMTRLFDRHGFASKIATKKFLNKIEEYDPDVVHLHNIHGYYLNIEMLFQWMKKHPEKEYIWTLHDCWAMTGHCSYFTAAECEQWKDGCYRCTQLKMYPGCIGLGNVNDNYKRKKKAFTGVNNLKLIVPSAWLGKIVTQSILCEYPTEVVHNTVNTNVFKKVNDDGTLVKRFGGKKVVLGVANVWTQRKGLDDFMWLANMLPDEYVIVLVGMTRQQIDSLEKEIQKHKGIPEDNVSKHYETECPKGILIDKSIYSAYEAVTGKKWTGKENGGCKVIGIERTDSAEELAALYSYAECFLNMTYEDNYPTVNLEAAACGTKVITYDVGGCRETIC